METGTRTGMETEMETGRAGGFGEAGGIPRRGFARPRAGVFVCAAGRHLVCAGSSLLRAACSFVSRFDSPRILALRSAMDPPTEEKWKMRPGYSASSTPPALACFTVPSMVSTGALKCLRATWRVESLVCRTWLAMVSYSASREALWVSLSQIVVLSWDSHETRRPLPAGLDARPAS